MVERCIKEFGIIDGIRIILWKICQYYKLSPIKQGIRKIKVKKINSYVHIRPNTSDVFLLLDFFCRRYENGGGEYDINFLNECKEMQYIIDAGANIGLFSLLYTWLYPKAKIIAIEAEEENYRLLLKNTAHIKNIICLHAGIWNKNVKLCTEARETGAWGFTVREADGNEQNTVQGVTISYLIDKYKWPCIDILKMDIEGSEYKVFQNNFETWLEKTKVLIIETHDRIVAGSDQIVTETMQQYHFLLKKNGENKIFLREV